MTVYHFLGLLLFHYIKQTLAVSFATTTQRYFPRRTLMVLTLHGLFGAKEKDSQPPEWKWRVLFSFTLLKKLPIHFSKEEEGTSVCMFSRWSPSTRQGRQRWPYEVKPSRR
uniref:Putative secreted protein n=1 Tax=Ixodes ricinus TaxID=34613 RepID=A0A6B0UJD6_IXORI